MESNKTGWQRASSIFAFVFSVIEAGLVLGLLKAGLLSLISAADIGLSFGLLATLWLAGYIALGAYILNGCNYILAMAFARYNLRENNRWVRIAFRFITSISAIGVPYVISGFTSDLIVEALN